MNPVLLLITLLLFALPAGAAEPAQSLLAELTRPMAPMPDRLGQVALIPSDESQIIEEQPGPVADLFTLEELRGKTESGVELALPDVDLPASDIPLALNSQVEYFLYYFQTRGKPAFSRWLSRSSRYIPMMKEVFKREGMPEDLVYVAMIESGFQVFVGLLCASVAAILPPNIGGISGFLYFLIPIGMTIIGMRRGSARRRLQATLATTSDS